MARPLQIEAAVRNQFEAGIAEQLARAGVEFDYEVERVAYTVPARDAAYIPDFVPRRSVMRLEGKGRFGGPRGGDGAKERKKLVLVRDQNPHLDIRIIFQRAANKIYPGSKTTYGQWATANGFMWSDKGMVPAEWIAEMKQQQQQHPKKGKAK